MQKNRAEAILGLSAQDRNITRYSGSRTAASEARVVGGDKPRYPGIRRGNRRDPRQPQFLDHPVLQRAERAFDACLRLRAIGTDDVDVQRRQRATKLG
jgi:hypothetical protein